MDSLASLGIQLARASYQANTRTASRPQSPLSAQTVRPNSIVGDSTWLITRSTSRPAPSSSRRAFRIRRSSFGPAISSTAASLWTYVATG